MSYTPQETKEHRAIVGMELLRFLMLKELSEEDKYPSIKIEKLNEVLLVAGQPLVVPEEIHKKEIDVIKVENKEEDYGDTV